MPSTISANIKMCCSIHNKLFWLGLTHHQLSFYCILILGIKVTLSEALLDSLSPLTAYTVYARAK